MTKGNIVTFVYFVVTSVDVTCIYVMQSWLRVRSATGFTGDQTVFSLTRKAGGVSSRRRHGKKNNGRRGVETTRERNVFAI